MSIKYLHILWFGAAALMAAGCASNPTPKATLQRGWIGGEFSCAKPALTHIGSSVYLRRLYPETPAEQAGLKAGDVIVQVNNEPVLDVQQLLRVIDSAKPGSQAVMHVWREKETLELPVRIGRETYQRWHSFNLGLGLSQSFDLWPDPDFSLLPLLQYKHPRQRVELHSPETALSRQGRKNRDRADAGVHSEEGWSAWFLLVGLNSYKQILKQETEVRVTRE